ncbi:MAG TPA: sensor histidine kinase [Nocardioidaceae bacterium]|nr:sensor histidine kinase [Nocardioidaceae bacterium]
MTIESATKAHLHNGYRHEALFWSGLEDFVAGTAPFVAEGVAAGEPVLVAVPESHWWPMRAALGPAAEQVHYVDMTKLGANPARIIPQWKRFVEQEAMSGVPVRGVGEPIWAGRRSAEINECQVHEALLNIAIGPDVPLWLRCPYDLDGLDDDVLEAAQRSHPLLVEQEVYRGSTRYGGVDYVDSVMGGELPEPPAGARLLKFDSLNIEAARQAVWGWQAAAHVGGDRLDDLALAVHEVAVNSVLHGGGAGWLRMWRQADALICDVRDNGILHDPLAGRNTPDDSQPRGRGLWMANQLCDLVQIRSMPDGTVVRLQLWL